MAAHIRPVLAALLLLAGCVPTLQEPAREPRPLLPERYASAAALTSRQSSSLLEPSAFFTDPHLRALIAEALRKNQELQLAALELRVARSEVLARSGEYLPRAELRAGGGLLRDEHEREELAADKNGAEYALGLFASWELDIWHKLRHAKQAAAKRYRASLAARRFLVTNLVAEVASSYYELLTLDGQVQVLARNVEIQRQALEVVKLQKQAGKVTELAVKRFQAEVLATRSKRFRLRQRVIQAENRLNFLLGRVRHPIQRSAGGFTKLRPPAVRSGLPSALLANRPDVHQAELLLQAAKLDVEVARARFYPALELKAGAAVSEAFELAEVPSSPYSLVYGLAAELVQPLWNRRGLKAGYQAANALQAQAVVRYERTLLQAYTEVLDQLARIENLARAFRLRAEQVQRLQESVEISGRLFRSARADYMEVLLTRRDALDAQMELIETKGRQLDASVRLYRALGGGWR